MEQTIFSRNKKIFTFLKRLSICFVLVSLLIVISAVSFSENIGDLFSKTGNQNESLYWYQVNYDIFRNNDSLKKLCIIASLGNNTKIIIEYTPILLKKEILKGNDLLSLTIQYIEALYDNGDTEKFRTTYRESISNFVGNNDITQPLSYIAQDDLASHETLLFALDIGDYILEENNQKNIFKMPVYFSQALIYQKLGNTVMHDRLLKLYEEVKKELLTENGTK